MPAVLPIAGSVHAMSDSSEEETPQPLQQRKPAAMAPASPARASSGGSSGGGLVLGLAAAGLAIAGGVALWVTGKKEGAPGKKEGAPKTAGTPKKVVPKRTPSQAAQADQAAEASGSAAAAAAPQARQAAAMGGALC